MFQIKTVASTLLLFGSAHAADLPVMETPADPVVTYSISRVEQATVTACEVAIAQWAAQFNPIDIDTTMTGPVRGRSGEDRAARLFVQIVYNRQGGPQTRAATIECTVAADGLVTVAEALD